MRTVEEIKGWDKDPARRPGYQIYRPVEPWPHTRFPPSQQAGEPAVPGKVTPVFGTSCPLRGPSGALRRIGYRYPEYVARRWLLLLVADRVEATGPRLRRLLGFGAPVFLAGLAALGGGLRPRRKKRARGDLWLYAPFAQRLPKRPSAARALW